MKRNLLLVGDFNRRDFLYPAEVLHDHYAIYFLEFLDKTEIESEEFRKWGKEVFWKDYKDAVDLIQKIRPEKVLFYFIESLNHVALNVACKYLGIKTYHIEHGIRNYEQLKNHRKKEGKTNRFLSMANLKKFKTIVSRVKHRQFFLNTIKRLPPLHAGFLKEYFRIRISHSIFDTFQKVNNPLRIADYYISFSSKIFDFHKISDHLHPNHPVFFIGCPSFDYFAGLANAYKNGEDIIFIDQPFEQQELFGWSVLNKERFLLQLQKFSSEHNRKLWIKKHPASNDVIFHRFDHNETVEIIKDAQAFKIAIQRSKIILGFFSTLLMPFMAMDHTVCFSWTAHPVKLDEEVAGFLIATGAINRIDSWKQFEDAVANLDSIASQQKKYKEQFIRDWMYKFDGKSSNRLRKVLTSDEQL